MALNLPQDEIVFIVSNKVLLQRAMTLLRPLQEAHVDLHQLRLLSEAGISHLKSLLLYQQYCVILLCTVCLSLSNTPPFSHEPLNEIYPTESRASSSVFRVYALLLNTPQHSRKKHLFYSAVFSAGGAVLEVL